jgi:F0F1-type ATP synthase assembly protein I
VTKPEEHSPAERDRSSAPSWTAFVSMGMSVAVCVAAGVLLGIWLDAVAKSSPLFLFLGLVAGCVLAGLIVVSLVRRKL